MNREKETFTVWISKYALTDGILEMEACNTISERMIVDAENRLHSFHKPYWHLTREEAVQHAKVMRIKKLQSLEKQVKKISALKFD